VKPLLDKPVPADIRALAHRSYVDPNALAFDRVRPCDDCPFRKDVPPEDGIGGNIPSMFADIDMGRFTHTCHKTDPRADGFIPTHEGPIQHCAGAIIMMLKSNIPPGGTLLGAIAKGRLVASRFYADKESRELRDFDIVMSTKELLDKYLDYFRGRLSKDRRRSRAIVTGKTYL
jgi:hypothetical protein